jgi:hypothetical protein
VWCTGNFTGEGERKQLKKISRQDIYTLITQVIKRPLSLMSTILAMGIIVFPLYQRSRGNYYLESINYIDGTTLIIWTLAFFMK